MALELEGRISQKLNVQTGTSARGPWSKQEFILEYQEGNFPSQVCMNVWGEDKVKELEKYQVGDRVKVSFNLSSREYNGRWYSDIRAWRIDPAGAPAAYPPEDYTTGAVAGGAGYVGGNAPAAAHQNDYAASAGNYAAPTGAPLPTADDMNTPEDDLPF